MYGIENPFIIGCICLVSIFALVASAERVVRHMIRIAKYFGVSDTFVGLTVLSIGTSLPEISSHIIASLGILQGTLDPEIASATVLGANIGSNIVQQTLIAGIVVLILGKLTFSKKFLQANYVALLTTMAIVRILGLDNIYSTSDGAILLLLFVLYIYFLYQQENEYKKEQSTTHTSTTTKITKAPTRPSINLRVSIACLCAGVGILLIASTITLEGVQYIVRSTGLSGSLVGVVTLGIASALPEFTTAISGIKKGAEGISVGTLIGSNIVNPLVAIGLGSIITPYIVPEPLKWWDLPVQIATALLLLGRVLMHNRSLGRGGGIFLIGLYIAYLYIRTQYFNID